MVSTETLVVVCVFVVLTFIIAIVMFTIRDFYKYYNSNNCSKCKYICCNKILGYAPAIPNTSENYNSIL